MTRYSAHASRSLRNKVVNGRDTSILIKGVFGGAECAILLVHQGGRSWHETQAN